MPWWTGEEEVVSLPPQVEISTDMVISEADGVLDLTPEQVIALCGAYHGGSSRGHPCRGHHPLMGSVAYHHGVARASQRLGGAPVGCGGTDLVLPAWG